MALSSYEIDRISEAIVTRLVHDDGFMKRMARLIPKEGKMLTSAQAAEKLGLSRKYVCDIAHHLGGIRGDGKSSHWTFPEDTLTELYLQYKKRNK